MDLRRVRTWDWLAGLSGLVLIVSLFLDWYKAGGVAKSAWQSFSFIDVILLLVGLLGIAIVVASATQRSGAVPQSLATCSVYAAVAAAILVVIRTASPPSFAVAGGTTREAGVWIGLVASLALLVTIWRSMGDQRLPGFSMRDVEITPLPPPTPEGERR